MNSALLLRFENRQLTAADIVTILNDSGYIVKIDDYSTNFRFETQCASGSSKYSFRFFDHDTGMGWTTGAVYVKRINDTLTADY